MSNTAQRSAFVARFDRIWAQARRVQLLQSLCWGVLTALAGIALLAAADYWLELPQAVRTAVMIATLAGAIAVAVMLCTRSVRRWRRQTTAATIEEVFPQLGQRIRTTVQFGPLSPGQIEGAGVATTLVSALEDDTVRRAQPLPLDAVVPWKSLALASMLAAVVGLSLAGASAIDWEWRAAARRAFLGDDPYTRIDVKPGNLTLKEGESAAIQIGIAGRLGEHVGFWSRRTDEQDAAWEEESFSPDDGQQVSDQQWEFTVPLERVRHPLEYRVTAGSAKTETFRVRVLYPLKIMKIASALQPPEYTGLAEQVAENGNLTGLVGSNVRLTIELDRPPETAWLEFAPMTRRAAGEAPAMKLPLAADGKQLTAEFDVTVDQTYSILAKDADGMELPENKFRIRARQDEPPQVWFESPAEALEVHSLAEIIMRARVSDDFGLSRAGVMFEVNNEEEYPLLSEDFSKVAAAAEELKTTGRLSPQTRATLERVLPLEHFELTQQDSVTYYAFAEDNRPGAAQRTESDLRFIDIRPFRRQYRVLDPDADGTPMNQGSRLKSLEELIARQRHALTRSIQLSRRFERSGQADLAGVDSQIKFQGELATSTRELAEGLEARGVDDTELLYQAETAMLAATDSLSAGKYDTATLQQRDALKYLIEGRNRLQIFIMKNPNRQLLAQLRQFDRMQQQKLRRPKTDEQEAREIAKRLEELADREDLIYKTLAGVPMNGTAPMDEPKPAEGSAKPEEAPPSRRELEDQQLDIALESREVEKTLGRLNGITDLTKERIASAAKEAEEAGAELGKGDVPAAKESAGEAGKQFRELVEQVKALLAQEQAQKIAAAQQMAAQLARQQQDFVDRLAKADQPGAGAGEPEKKEEDKPGAGKEKKPGDEKSAGDEKNKMGGPGEQAEEIARKAQTLADVLGAAAKSDDPQEEAAAKKIEGIVGSLKLKELTARLQDLPGQAKDGKNEEARAAAGDGAERMEAAAQQLGMLHRSIVAPKVDELAKLEEKLVALDEELDQLDAPAKITDWHLAANELLEELKDKSISQQPIEQFIEEMKKAGWGPEVRSRGWNWVRTEGGYYASPQRYRVLTTRILASLRGQIQELLLGDLAGSRDEPIPPQYQDLVDRYYQVLASEGKKDK